MSDKTAIRVNGVSKDFILPHEKISSVKGLFTKAFRRNRNKETQHALKGVSFEVREGEFFGIVGRNGSGKSTLLKILAGIYQPTGGTTETRGKLVPFIELGVGFNPELTGRENVYLNGAMLGFSRQEVRAMYDDIVSFAELERFMDQKLKNYSSGMQVRLAFSMAVRAEADILLIDEVLAVGDADFQRKCFDYFKRLKLEGKTVVFVSHDMNAVREFCDRAMLLEQNQIVHIGQTSEVAERYTKLFNKANPAEAKKDNKQGSRWGTGKVRLSDVQAVATPDSVDITMTIAVKANIEDPVIGFRVRSADGREVTGTNTKVEGHNPGQLVKGSTVKVAWSFKNVLSDGKYYIDPSVINPDGTTVHDWWNKAATLAVKKSRHLPYAMDPGFSFSLEEPPKQA